MNNVTLMSPTGKKVVRSRGFSVRFLVFGSINYFLSGRFVKFIFSWVWYLLTLVWWYNPAKVNSAIIDVMGNVSDFFGSTLKQDKLAGQIMDVTSDFVGEVNCELTTIAGIEITRLAVLGLVLFLLVRLFVAFRYNKREIKRMVKIKKYTIVPDQPAPAPQSPRSFNPVPPVVQQPQPVYQQQPQFQQPVYAQPVYQQQPVPPVAPPPVQPAPAPYSYERTPTTAAARSMQSKRAVELHLLNEAYAAGLISYDVYVAKKAILESE